MIVNENVSKYKQAVRWVVRNAHKVTDKQLDIVLNARDCEDICKYLDDKYGNLGNEVRTMNLLEKKGVI